MYETIPRPNFNTLASVTQQTNTTTQTSEGVDQSCSVAPSPCNMSPARYMDRPVLTSHHLNKSFTESHQRVTDVATNSENEQEQMH